jgi:tetratricopeptide (TPR) repeat protein
MRLCRSNAAIKFTGKIPGTIADINPASLVNPPKEFMRILDYAHMENRKNRCIQNINMIAKEKSEPASDPWLDYRLAVEYWLLKDYSQAYEAINLAMVGFLGEGLLPPSDAYLLKYDILIRTEDYTAIHDGIDKAVRLYPHYPDLYFYKGIMELKYEQYEKAVKTFSYCIIMGESAPEYLTHAGIGSFWTFYYLGLCYEKQQNYPAAAESYRQAIAYYPDFIAARQKLGKL